MNKKIIIISIAIVLVFIVVVTVFMNKPANLLAESSSMGSFITIETSEGVTIIEENGKYGYLLENGEWLLPADYDEVMPFYNGVGCVRKDSLWGHVTRDGQLVQPQYIQPYTFLEEFAIVTSPDNTLLIKKDNSIELFNITVGEFSEGLAILEGQTLEENKWAGIVEENTRFSLFEKRYDTIRPFSEGVAIFQTNGDYGAINQYGEIVIAPQYLSMTDFMHGISVVSIFDDELQRYLYGIINNSGEYTLPLEYDLIGDYDLNTELLRAEKDGKWGYLGKDCAIAIPLIYDFAGPFQSGLALVKMNDRFGYINSGNEVIIDLQYDFGSYFIGEYAVVYPVRRPLLAADELNASVASCFIEQYEVIDREGNTIYSPGYTILIPNSTHSHPDSLLSEKGYPVYDVSGEISVAFDMNGFYDLNSDRKIIQEEPLIMVYIWNENIPYENVK